MDRLLTPDEMNKAVFFEDEDGELCVKPDSYLEVAKAQRHATLEEVKGIIQKEQTVIRERLNDRRGHKYLGERQDIGADILSVKLLKAIEGLE